MFWGDGNVLYLVVHGTYTVCIAVKTHQSEQLRHAFYCMLRIPQLKKKEKSKQWTLRKVRDVYNNPGER